MSASNATSSTPINISDEEWKKRLTKDQYYVTRQKGTERVNKIPQFFGNLISIKLESLKAIY